MLRPRPLPRPFLHVPYEIQKTEIWMLTYLGVVPKEHHRVPSSATEVDHVPMFRRRQVVRLEEHRRSESLVILLGVHIRHELLNHRVGRPFRISAKDNGRDQSLKPGVARPWIADDVDICRPC